MFYENHLRQLVSLRADYWQSESISQRNLKLSQMVLCANACGKDIIEFVLEGKSENTNLEESKKEKISDNQIFTNTKSEPYLRKSKSEKAKSGSYLRNVTVFTKTYGCPFCDFTTHSPNALSGHRTGDPDETPQLKIPVV
jgi:hypothetical protein